MYNFRSEHYETFKEMAVILFLLLAAGFTSSAMADNPFHMFLIMF